MELNRACRTRACDEVEAENVSFNALNKQEASAARQTCSARLPVWFAERGVNKREQTYGREADDGDGGDANRKSPSRCNLDTSQHRQIPKQLTYKREAKRSCAWALSSPQHSWPLSSSSSACKHAFIAHVTFSRPSFMFDPLPSGINCRDSHVTQ